MAEDTGTAPSTALQRAATELSLLLARDSDQAEYISGQAEIHLLALLLLLRGRPWNPDDIEALEQLRTDWFLQRPWYHRVPIDVAISITSGRALPEEFYVNLWVQFGRAELAH